MTDFSTTTEKHLPLVSVLMPVYNAAQYVQESIDSILNQTYTNIEFLIYNDGSTDNSAAIVQAAADKDPRIVFYDSNANSGYVSHLNAGLRQAKGKYIARLDADDVAHLERLALQVSYMEAHPAVGLCGSAVRMFGSEGETIVNLPEDDSVIRLTMCLQNAFFHPAVTLRRSVLLKHNLQYRLDYMPTEDYRLWCEMSAVTQLHNLPQVLLNYRIHPHQISRRQTERGQRITGQIRQEQMAQFGIVFNDEQRQAFELLNAARNYPHLKLSEYQKISKFIQQLYSQMQGTKEGAAVAYKVLNFQWYEVLKTAARFRPHLLPLLAQHPLGGVRLSKTDLTLAVKYLVSWRPNLPTYLKRYWRQRLSR